MNKNNLSSADGAISSETRNLLNAFSEPIFVTDSHGKIVFNNNSSSGFIKDEYSNISEVIPGLELNGKGSPVFNTVVKHFNGTVTNVPVEINVNKWEQNYLIKLYDITNRMKNEDVMMENSKILESIINSAMDGIITIDEEQNIVQFNPAAEMIFLYNKEDVIGKSLDFLIPQRFREAHRGHIRGFIGTFAIKHSPGESGKITGLRSNGEEFPIEGSISQIFIENKKLFSVILRDITKRVESEENLKEANKQIKNILDTITDNFIALDREFKFKYINKKVLERSNLNYEDVIGKSIWDVFPNMIGTIYEQYYRKAFEEQTPLNFAERSVLTDEWYDVNIYPSEDGITVYGKNITEKKLAEDNLKASERTYRTLFNSTLDGIMIVNDEGYYIDVNESLCRMLKVPKEKLLNSYFTDYVPEDRMEDAIKAFESLKEKGYYEGEFPLKASDGTLVHIEWRSTGNFQPGINMCTARDISIRKEVQNKLIEEFNIRKAIEISIPEGITTADNNGIQTYANPAFCQMLGFEHDELIDAKPPFIYWPEEEIENISKAFEQTLSGKAPHDGFELIFKKKNEERINVLIVPKPIKNAFGEVEGWLTSTTDITNRKKAENALAESEERFRTIADTANEGVWLINSNAETIYANGFMAELLGITTDDMINRKIHEFVFEEDVELIKNRIKANIEGYNEEFDFRFRKADGGEIYVMAGTSPIYDSNGKITGALGMFSDITERKKAEIALAESEKRFRNTLDTMKEGAAIIDFNWTYLYANEVHAKHAHHKLEDIIGNNYLELLPGIKDTPFYEGFIRCMNERTTQHIVSDFTYPDGTKAWYDVYLEPVPEGVFNLSLDITERVKAEEALRKREHILNLILENVNEGIIVSDALNSKILAISRWDLNNMNGSMSNTIMDIPMEQFFGLKDVRDIKTGERVKGEALPISRALRGEFIHNEEWLLARPGGSSFTASVNAIPVYNEDKSEIINAIAIWTDISERKKAEEALKESESRYRSTLDNMMEGCAIIDFGWNYLYVNEANAKHAHLKREEMIGKNLLELIPGVENSIFYSAYKRSMEERISEKLEASFNFADGSLAWFEVMVQPVPEGIFVLSEDITERKQAEDALRKSEERFSVAFRTNPDSLVISKVDDGTMVEVNETFLKLFGWEHEEVIGKSSNSLDMFVNPDDRNTAIEKLRNHGRVRNYETRIKLKSGEERIALLSAELLPMDKEQTLLTIIQDVTEVKQAENALKESEQKYKAKSQELETLLDAIPSIVWIAHDPECKVMTGNKASYDFLKLAEGVNVSASTSAVLNARIVEQRINGVPVKAEDLPMQKSVRTKKSYPAVEIEMIFDNGQSRILYGNAVPIFDDKGNVTGSISAFIDATDRKKMELELKLSQDMYREKSEELETILETIPTPVWIAHDPDAKVITGNKASYEVLKAPEGKNVSATADEPIIDEILTHLVDGKEVESHDLPIQKCLKTGESIYGTEVEYRFRSGEIKYMLGNVVPVLDKDNKVKGCISSFSDVTEIKMAQKALLDSEERYKEKSEELETILETIPTPVWIAKDPEAKYIAGNKSANAIMGLPEGGNASLSTNASVLSGLIKQYMNGVEVEPSELPIQKCLSTGKTIKSAEIEFRYPSGRNIYLLGNAVPVLDKSNNIKGCVSAFTDITEIKKYQQALKENEDRLKFSMKNANAGSWEWDIKTGEEKWSAEYYELFGLYPGKVQPTFENWVNTIHPDDRDRVLSEMDMAIDNNGTDLNTEFRAFHVKKGIRWINAIGKATYNENGEPLKIAGISLDITERKITERHLDIQYSIANALTEAQTLKDATYKVLGAICRELGWELGIWWVVDKEKNILKIESIWKSESITESGKGITDPFAVFMPGEGLPGAVWIEDNPKWVQDIMNDINFPRKKLAARQGLHAALAFPTRSGDEVTGIIECFSQEILNPNDDLLELFDAAGRQIGNFVERKKAEAKYRDLYENAPDMYISFDPGTARITQCNRTLAESTGYTKNEIIGQSIFGIFHKSCRRKLNIIRKEFEEKGEIINAELQLRRKDGSKIDVILNASAVRDEEGNIIYSRSGMRDITERKKFEQEIKQRDIELTDFIEKAPVGLNRIAEDGTILWSNNTEIKNLGFKKDEFINYNIKDFLLEENTWSIILQRLRNDEQIKNMDVQFKEKHGGFKYLLLSANVYKEDGKFAYVKTFTRDITPRKIAESHLKTQYSISTALSESRTLKSAAEKALEAVCDGIGWKAALWWRVDETTNTLMNYASWYSRTMDSVNTDILNEDFVYQKGNGLPGRVWKKEKALYVPNIIKNKNFVRLNKFVSMGIESAFAFPIKVGEKVIAVVECFGDRVIVPNQDLIDMLESTGRQMGNFIERIKAEDALMLANETLEDRVIERTAQLKNVIDKLEHEIEERQKAEKEIEILAQAMKSTNDSVCITDLKNKMLFVNSAFEKIYGYTEEEVLGKSVNIIRSSHTGSETIKKIYESTLEGGWQGEIINTKKNGTEFPVWLSTSVIRDNHGQPRALINVTIDITETKKTQMLLQQQADLVKLLQEITVAANQTFNLDEALKFAVDKICLFTKWEVGHVYKVTKEKVFESTKIWHFSNMRKFNTFRNITERTILKKNKGIPGLVYKQKKAVWIYDVTKSPQFTRKHPTLDIKLRSAFLFPVFIENEIICILEFYTTKLTKLNENTLNIMYNIGTQLGRVAERQRAIETIRDSETKFKAVAETANDAIISIDSESNIVYFNYSAEIIFDYKKDELTGSSFHKLFSTQFRNILKQSNRELIKNGVSVLSGKTIEVTGLKKDGTEFPAELSISNWQSSDGMYFTAMIRDITERKEAELKLLKNEKQLKDAQHIAHIGSFEWDIVNDKVYWSEELYRIYGVKYHEFEGTFEGFLKQIDPKDRENVQQTIIQSYQSSAPFSIEEKIIRPNGEIRILLIRGEFIKDQLGKTVRLIGACQDITERKEAEEQLRISEKGLKDSQRIAHLGSWEWEMKTGKLVYSDEFLRIYGQDPNNFDPNGFDPNKYIHPEDKEWAAKLGQSLISNQKPFSVHYRIVLPDKTIKILKAEGQVEKDNMDIPIRMFGSILDVTEQKLAEEELRQANEKLHLAQNELIHSEKLAALGRFSSGIAHEIRNPLANISALAQILMSKYKVDPKMKKHLRYILINTDIANRIIKDLLNFAAPDEAPYRAGSIEKIINNLYNIVKSRCIRNKVHLIKQISPHLPEILLNEKKLQAAFLNFISNAIDAMPKGGKLRIEAEHNKNTNEVIVTFEDTGSGISQEYMDKIFEPFFTTKDDGTGLGLSLAYQVIKSHEGKLEIQSRVGHGTKIEVKIPAQKEN
ncbi:MAG: PAS domain S-box protein [Ignavibacteriae bacterium]|nr:MAG: PAS domain S-box protein [Ignavibacteriota bacterium]